MAATDARTPFVRHPMLLMLIVVFTILLFLFLLAWRDCANYFPCCFMIPVALYIPLVRRITAVGTTVVDPSSNVLEPVFCLVNGQQQPSTIHQRAKVGERYKLSAARDSRDNSCYSCTRYMAHVRAYL